MELIKASEGNDIRRVTLLLEQGEVDIDAKNENGLTSLHFASWLGRLEIANLLLASGANIDAQTNKGNTPLHVACWNDRSQIVELLLRRGANVEIRNKEKFKPKESTTNKGF